MAQIKLKQGQPSYWRNLNCTRLFVVIQGNIGGLAGMAHGINEILLGNSPTAGLIFDYRTGAFSILPTYLITGIATICLGLALIAWTIGFIHRKSGPAIFLIISILLFLVGGGIAQVGFFIIAWGVSTRINQPPDWWKSDISGKKRKRLAGSWLAFFTAGYLFLLTGIAIWLIFTPPGTIFRDHSTAYLLCWASLLLGVVLQVFTIISGFARDLERQEQRGQYATND